MDIREELESNTLDEEERKGLLGRQSELQKHHSDDSIPSLPGVATQPNTSNNSAALRWFRLLALLLCLVAALFFTDRMELFHNDKPSDGHHQSSPSTIIPQDSQPKQYSIEGLQAQRAKLMLRYNFSNPSAINYTALVQELNLARVFNPQYPTSAESSKDDSTGLPSWCTNDPEHPSNQEDPLHGNRMPYVSGILYNKMPKAASSTLSGIVLRIAHNVAKRFKRADPCTSFQHHITNEGEVKSLFHGRDFAKSFLFSSVRDPAAQALSHIYFRHVSRKKKTSPSDKKMMEYLSDPHHQNGVVSNGVGGYQIAYLVFDMLTSHFAWNPRIDPSKVLRPMQVHKVVQVILGKYDFFVSVERFDESLVAMQLLLGLETSDILYLSSKAAGQSYSYSKKQNSCFFLQKPNASDPIAAYLASDTWYAQQYGDYILVEAVKQSLDLTIEYLGKSRFDRALEEFRRMLKKGEEACAASAKFPCSNQGEPQLEAAEESCYFSDWGCGYACLDRLANDIPDGG